MGLQNYTYSLTGESSGSIGGCGSGFIIKYDTSFYLISNYHVMTGKHPEDDLPLRPDSATSIIVSFRTLNGTKIFHPMKYDLYDNNRNERFATLWVNNLYRLDLAILPIFLPDTSVSNVYYHAVDQIDTSRSIDGKTNGSVIGFRNCQFIDGWKPTVSLGLVIDSVSKTDEWFEFLAVSKKGESGSPVYSRTKSGEKIVGILSATLSDFSQILAGYLILDALIKFHSKRPIPCQGYWVEVPWNK